MGRETPTTGELHSCTSRFFLCSLAVDLWSCFALLFCSPFLLWVCPLGAFNFVRALGHKIQCSMLKVCGWVSSFSFPLKSLLCRRFQEIPFKISPWAFKFSLWGFEISLWAFVFSLCKFSDFTLKTLNFHSETSRLHLASWELSLCKLIYIQRLQSEITYQRLQTEITFKDPPCSPPKKFNARSGGRKKKASLKSQKRKRGNEQKMNSKEPQGETSTWEVQKMKILFKSKEDEL